MIRLKKILETKTAGVICFLFAVINRIVFTTVFSRVGADTKLQLLYAKNFLDGKGLGMTKYFTADVSTPVFDTQQVFPPGFSFAIIPFIKLFNGNESRAVFAYDIVVAILFVIAVRHLARKIGLSNQLKNIVTIIAGCSQYFFFMSWSPTDTISVCWILFSLSETITIINKKQHINWIRSVGYGFLFFLPFFFRYMYLLITLLLPILVLLYGFILKTPALKKSGFRLLITSTLFLLIYWCISLFESVNALYIDSGERGLFFKQLLECYPFLPASLINIDFAAQLVEKIFGIEYTATMYFLKIINLLLLLMLLSLFFKCIISKRYIDLSPHSLFIIIGSSLSLTILFLLFFLSITYKEYFLVSFIWTQVKDPRYFAFVYVFIPLLVFVCIQYYKQSLKNLFLKAIVLLALVAMTTEVLHGIYFNIKVLSSQKDLVYLHEAEIASRHFHALLKDVSEKNPGKEIIVCSSESFYLYEAMEMGYKAIFDYSNFLKSDLKVLSETVILMPVSTANSIHIQSFLMRKKPVLVSEITGISFYTINVSPVK